MSQSDMSTSLVPAQSVTVANSSSGIYDEPLDTPGVIPQHLKRKATFEYPLIEIAQRLFMRMKPEGTMFVSNLEAILAIIALYKAAAPVYEHLKKFVLWGFTSHVTVADYDPIAKDILTWMATNVIVKGNSTSAILQTGELGDSPESAIIQGRMLGMGMAAQGSEDTRCVPTLGRRLFWIGFRPFTFSRVGGDGLAPGARHGLLNTLTTNEAGDMHNSIVIRTVGWSLNPLQEFINTCSSHRRNSKHGTTTIYFSNSGNSYQNPAGMWTQVTKATRNLDTIDMDPDVKADLIRDAEYYYSDDSRNFFAECGIPYRRGYMFHGPPGTGKTSFSAALAGHLRCDVYIINIASGDVSDGRLHQLFLSLPRKSVVVIEDIDSAGIGREQGPAAPPAVNPQIPGVPVSGRTFPGLLQGDAPKRPRNTVTLSGLLNAIDGNASAEGRLLIMTSNSPDTLDEALTRPGRIDKMVHFGKMMPQAARDIFKRLIGRTAVAKAMYSEAMMEEFAKTFSEMLWEDTFTPAGVQSYLQWCRGDALLALQELPGWMAQFSEKVVEEAEPVVLEERDDDEKEEGNGENMDIPTVESLLG